MTRDGYAQPLGLREKEEETDRMADEIPEESPENGSEPEDGPPQRSR
jgi:hypothetical protein